MLKELIKKLVADYQSNKRVYSNHKQIALILKGLEDREY